MWYQFDRWDPITYTSVTRCSYVFTALESNKMLLFHAENLDMFLYGLTREAHALLACLTDASQSTLLIKTNLSNLSWTFKKYFYIPKWCPLRDKCGLGRQVKKLHTRKMDERDCIWTPECEEMQKVENELENNTTKMRRWQAGDLAISSKSLPSFINRMELSNEWWTGEDDRERKRLPGSNRYCLL